MPSMAKWGGFIGNWNQLVTTDCKIKSCKIKFGALPYLNDILKNIYLCGTGKLRTGVIF